MRSRRAITFLPALALAPIGFLVSCSSDGNDAVGSTVAVSSQPGGATDTGGSTDSSATSGSDVTSGPSLADLVQVTLANGSARYMMAADANGTIDDLVAGLLQSADGSASSGSGSDGSTDSSGSTPEAAGGCELPPSDRLSGAAQTDAALHCVVLPDGTQLVVEDRDIYLGADGAWTVTSVQFDQALAQLETEQLVALHDPLAVLEALSTAGADATASDGMNGLEYDVTLQLTDVDDPFLVAVAQRAGAQTITVHVYADDAGTEVRAMAYEFTQAATTTGGATGSGTGGTTTAPGSESTSGSPQNPAGGGNGSTTSAVASLPDSGSSTVPSTMFEDIPNVAVALIGDTSSVTISLPTEADTLNLGDLGASFTVELGNGQG